MPASNSIHHEQRMALQAVLYSGKLADYLAKPLPLALREIGFDPEFSPSEWAKLDWYGPLELWRGPEHEVSDILYNGRAEEPFFIVQRGAMLNTGVIVDPTWIAWLHRQLALRSQRCSAEELGARQWPLAQGQGVADGLRYAITAPPLSRDGGSLAVRVLPERWRSLDDLVRAGVLTREAGELLIEALRSGASLLIAGSTGSGKTTLAAALTQELGRSRRLVFIEDGGELPRTHNSLHIDVSEGGNAFARAVSFALRQKPDYIVVGEVRGGEAMALLQAASTGHPALGTIHANNTAGALRNLERMALLGLAGETGGGGQSAAQIVRGLIASEATSLLVLHIGLSAKRRRSVLAIDEVLRMGAQGQSGDTFPTGSLFRHDPATDGLVRSGYVQGAWGLGRL